MGDRGRRAADQRRLRRSGRGRSPYSRNWHRGHHPLRRVRRVAFDKHFGLDSAAADIVELRRGKAPHGEEVTKYKGAIRRDHSVGEG